MPTVPADSSRWPQAHLRFESEAAFIQLESAHLLKDTTGEFVRFYRSARWSGSDGTSARRGLSACRELSERWEALAPPSYLRPFWEEIAKHLRALGTLYEELLVLQERPEGQQVEPVVRLQAAFNARLHWMNLSERKLLETEERAATRTKETRREH